MCRSLDLKSKAEKSGPKHVAMSEMDRHSLNMGGKLTERAGGGGASHVPQMEPKLRAHPGVGGRDGRCGRGD